jgi:methyl-accepting chemotaxis protein
MFCGKYQAKIAQLEVELNNALALQQALDRSTAIIELTPDGRIAAVNANFCAAVGYSEAELVGQHHRMLCDDAYARSGEYVEFWRRLRNGEYCSGTIKRRKKSGTDIWLEASYNPVLDNNGRVEKVVKFATDVTHQVEEAASQKAMVQAIERSMAVIEFSLSGHVLRANENFLRVMGYGQDEILGRHHRVFCAQDYVGSSEYSDFWASLGRGEYLSGQFQRINRHGDEVWLEASYNPVFDPDGKPCKVVKFASDITRQTQRNIAERNSADMAYNVALETKETSQTGERILDETVSKIETIARIVEGSSDLVNALGEQTKRISSIVNTIREIADQTNLLALNAAIEAARAGESGRGFAVVADEVRKLAERTSSATGEIGQMIQAIQSETRSVCSSMDRGLSEVTQGVELANKAGGAIKQMRDGATRVVEVIHELSKTVGR